MIKNAARSLLQKIFGFNNYLFIFSIFSINRIKIGRLDKEFLFFLDLIPNEGAILDIGANIGIMSVLLAKKFKKATIYSFEPVPENLKALQRIIRFYHLKNVHVIPTALGDTDGQLTMILPELAGAQMQGLSHVKNDNNEKGREFTVPVQVLDNIREINQLSKIVAIKIDVENFEYYVLKGGKSLIEKHHPVIFCELWNDERKLWCIHFIKSLGYSIKVFEKNGLVDFINQPVENFFFVYN